MRPKKIEKYNWDNCTETFKQMLHGACIHKCLFNDSCSKTSKYCVAVTSNLAYIESLKNINTKLSTLQDYFSNGHITCTVWERHSIDALLTFINKWGETKYAKTKEFKELTKRYSDLK